MKLKSIIFLILTNCIVTFAADEKLPSLLSNENKVSSLKFPEIFPTPRELQLSTGSFLCPAKVSIFEQNGNSIASQELSRILMDKWGVVSNMYSDSSNTTPTFKFVLSNSNSLPKSTQGYILEVGKDNVVIKARTKSGLFYGMQTLREMMKLSSSDKMLRVCVVRDWPACKMRGCYLCLNSINVSENTVSGLKRLIDLFASLKLNTLVVEIAGNMRYDKEKFTNKSPFSKKQVAELAAYAKSRYFEVIPYLQTLSHTRWIFSHPGYKKLLEVPDDASWTTAMCPSNPRANKFIENIIEENIEVFKPSYFHLGLDEIYMGPFRECPKCKKKKPSSLFLSHIKKTTAILKKHKITPIIYHDSLLPGEPVLGNKIPVNMGIIYDKVHGWEIVNQLDRNTVINIWDYNAKPNKSFLKYFSQKGFPIFAATSCTDSLVSVQKFSRLLKQYSNSLGIIMTYWFHAKNDWTNPLKNLSREALAATLFIAQYSWNSNATDIENIKYDPVYEMRKRINSNYNRISATELEYIPINLNRLFNVNIGNIPNWPILNNPLTIKEWNKSLGNLAEKFKLAQTDYASFGAIALSGRKGDGLALNPVTIPMNIKANALVMLHTSSPPDSKKYQMSNHICDVPQIGKYVINYMDGTQINIPLLYRDNITDWNSFLSGKNSSIALHEHDAIGNIVSFVKFKWLNPFPEKVIRDIVMYSSMTDGIAPALLGLTAIKQKNEFKKLINFSNINVLQIKKLLNVSLSGSKKKISISKSFRNSNELKIIIPPAPKTLRLCFDIKINEDLSSLKQIRLRIRTRMPYAILNSGIYLGKDIYYSPCWYKYRLIDNKSIKQQKIDLPISEMKKTSDFSMNQFKYMRISIWIKNPKPTIIYFNSPEWSSGENTQIMLRKKIN